MFGINQTHQHSSKVCLSVYLRRKKKSLLFFAEIVFSMHIQSSGLARGGMKKNMERKNYK